MRQTEESIHFVQCYYSLEYWSTWLIIHALSLQYPGTYVSSIMLESQNSLSLIEFREPRDLCMFTKVNPLKPVSTDNPSGQQKPGNKIVCLGNREWHCVRSLQWSSPNSPSWGSNTKGSWILWGNSRKSNLSYKLSYMSQGENFPRHVRAPYFQNTYKPWLFPQFMKMQFYRLQWACTKNHQSHMLMLMSWTNIN